MKNDFFRKWKWFIITLLISCTIIPLCINTLFKIPAPIELLEAEWDAGDALTLFSAIFASILAIYGISLTIKASNEGREESIRNEALPFIIVEFLKIKPEKVSFLNTEPTEFLPDPSNKEFEEYALREYFFIITDSGIEVARALTGEQQTIVQKGGLITTERNGVIFTTKEQFVYCHFLLENAGKGVAVNTRVGLNKKTVQKNERKYVMPVQLKVGDSLSVGIYADNLSKISSKEGEYQFEILYYDMYGNKYCQQYSLLIRYDSSKVSTIAQFSTEHKQIICERKNI